MLPTVLTPHVVEKPHHPSGPRFTAAQRNVRVDNRVHPHRSPDPPRQGDTPEVGSLLLMAPSRRAKYQTYVSLNIADIQAVQDDDFGRHVLRGQGKWLQANQIQQLPGAQLPFNERANVRKPSAVAYGSLFELTPNQEYTYR